MDQVILDFFVNHRVEWFSFLMLTITYSGSYAMITGITFLSIISFYVHKYFSQISPLLISVAGSAVTVFFIKNIFYRSRPLEEAFYLEPGFSFPSGHAALAVALYGFLLYIVWKHKKHYLKNSFIIFLSVLIILIGLSRLYLGVHYFSDVLMGYVIGFIWILLSIRLTRRSFRSGLGPT